MARSIGSARRGAAFAGLVAALGAGALFLTSAACRCQQDPHKASPSVRGPADLAAGAPGSSHGEAGHFKTGAGEAHVGYLIANVEGAMDAPLRYCLDDGALYQGAPYRLGRINVFFAGALSGKTLNGPVIVHGRRQAGLDRKLTRVGPCPAGGDASNVPQLRSDQVAPEADWRGHTTRARLEHTDYIEATAISPLPLVDAERAADGSLRLRLTNPFDRPLPAGVTFSLYYEVGTKKPMPRFEAQALAALAPGASQTFPVPPAAPGEPRSSFRGYQLTGTIGDVRIDLLVTLPPPTL